MESKKYSAINIGPIIDTLSMARKPRELWAASYMFSYFMECIMTEIKKNVEKVGGMIISPAILKNPPFNEVGLFPDRVFVEGDLDIKSIVNNAVDIFSKVTGVGLDYANVMSVSIVRSDRSGVIKELNRLLDSIELYNKTIEDGSRKKVLNLIQKSPERLFKLASGNTHFYFPALCEIATDKLLENHFSTWTGMRDKAYQGERKYETDKGEDEFYVDIKKEFKEEYHSYFKYICVVQADGDNMGKIVSALETDKVATLSLGLLNFGSEASRMVKEYGGLPIYAGGDDLLFIAPVVSNHEKNNNIFNLLAAIDIKYQSMVDDIIGRDGIVRPIDDEKKELHTSMSYGLSISYYKYPLYEALENARNLLFKEAKNVKGKNAIAWSTRKHSGSGFTGVITKDSSKDSVYKIFEELVKYSVDDALVSAVAHKLRSNEDLLDILRYKENRDDRVKAFYLKIMEEPAGQDDNNYMAVTRILLCALFKKYDADASDKKVETKDVLSTMYGMLRTAKFINGEGDDNE